jgi:hypothetical protein
MSELARSLVSEAIEVLEELLHDKLVNCARDTTMCAEPAKIQRALALLRVVLKELSGI